MTDLAQKLAMTHVQKSDEELRLELDQKDAPEEAKADPRDAELYTFQFEYTTMKGKKYSATFTNKVMDVASKMQIGSLESQFNGGQPYDSIEPVQAAVNRAVAWMTLSLGARKNQVPKGWADNIRKLKDDYLILSLFEEVSGHEGIFHGRLKAEEASQGEEGDAPAGA